MKNTLALLLLLPTLSLATTCPSLQGKYLCPGNSGYPDFTLNISETLSGDKKSAEYVYDYPELGIPKITVLASNKGVLNQDTKPYWATCFRDVMFYTNQDNATGFFQSTSLTQDSDLEVFVRGELAIVCKKKI